MSTSTTANSTITVTRTEHVTIHTYTAPENGWRANSHVIELPSQLILVDTPLLPDDASELLDYAGNLGKPISRVYISHAHPDHFATAGLTDAPKYALAATAKAIATQGAAIVQGAYALTGHGSVEPVGTPTVDETVEAGEEIIDGVRVSFESVSSAESGEQLTIGFPDEGILITQDVIYNNVHAFLGHQLFDGWITAIDALERGPYTTILPGHGLPGDRSLFASTRAYVSTAREALAAASGPADLNSRLEAAFPSYGGTAMQPMQNYFLYPKES